MKNIFISGTTSGLGKYLYKNIRGSMKFHRKKKNKVEQHSILIHCAFFKKKINSKKNKRLVIETMNLFKKVEKCQFEKIIFISTIDINNDEFKKNLYVKLKKKIEDKISLKKKYYIFRCGMLAGKYMKKNSLFKLINSKVKTELTLSKSSSIYLTSHSDVCKLIKKIIKNKDLKFGTYNLISKNKFYFKNFKNKNILFGNYKLNYKKLSNMKLERNFNFHPKSVNKIISEIEKL